MPLYLGTGLPGPFHWSTRVGGGRRKRREPDGGEGAVLGAFLVGIFVVFFLPMLVFGPAAVVLWIPAGYGLYRVAKWARALDRMEPDTEQRPIAPAATAPTAPTPPPEAWRGYQASLLD